ncbi:hypothetical protein [Halobaculum sp. D14]|uniref:hypothetical protein n=1 Tax=Halobaculum sp. D14 TaxID=3421642 RepID=UPI003EB95965
MSETGPRQSLHAYSLLALVVLVAFAGCSGLGGQATSTPAATTTTADAVTESELALLPHGLSEDGVTNATLLAERHETNVVGMPGKIVMRTNASLLDRTVHANTTATATANLTEVAYESQGVTTGPNVSMTRSTTIMANETAIRQHVVVNGNTTLANTRNLTAGFDRALRGLTTGVNPLRGIFKRGNFTVTNITETERGHVIVLKANEYTSGKLYDAANVSDYHATVRMTANGTVLKANEYIQGTEAANRRHYRFSFEFIPEYVNPDLRGLE